MARGRPWRETLGGPLRKRTDLPLAAALMAVDNLFQLGNAGFEAADLRITLARWIGKFARVVYRRARLAQ